jgi:chromosomal replication initiation ATPase DnaA
VTAAPARPQLPLELGHPIQLGERDFVVAEGNRAALGWIESWPRWPGPALAIHGPAGSGKTHLAHLWTARSGAALLSAADLAGLDPEQAAAGPVALDGLGAAPLSAGEERALLHLHNLLAERGRHLLLLGRQPPARWPILLPDLRSRLAAAASVAVAEPDDALLEAVLAKLFADRQVAVGPELPRYLAARIERSFAAAQAVVARLDRAALAAGRPISLRLAHELLGDDDRA